MLYYYELPTNCFSEADRRLGVNSVNEKVEVRTE